MGVRRGCCEDLSCAWLGLLCPCCQDGGAGWQGLLIPVSLRMPMAAFWSRCWSPENHEDDLWFCWNNSHEYHHFGGKKLCLAVSYSGCSSWFCLLLLEVEPMGFFTGWLLVCTRAAGWALLPPGLGEKAFSAPAVTRNPGSFLGPGFASPAIASFVLPLIQFSVSSGSVKQFVDVIPLLCQQAPLGLC